MVYKRTFFPIKSGFVFVMMVEKGELKCSSGIFVTLFCGGSGGIFIYAIYKNTLRNNRKENRDINDNSSLLELYRYYN